jgi:hypothetical protein
MPLSVENRDDFAPGEEDALPEEGNSLGSVRLQDMLETVTQDHRLAYSTTLHHRPFVLFENVLCYR